MEFIDFYKLLFRFIHEIDRFCVAAEFSIFRNKSYDNSPINISTFYSKSREKSINPNCRIPLCERCPGTHAHTHTHEIKQNNSIRDNISYYYYKWLYISPETNYNMSTSNIEITLKIHIFGSGGSNETAKKKLPDRFFSVLHLCADAGFISHWNFVWLRHTAASVIIIRQ